MYQAARTAGGSLIFKNVVPGRYKAYTAVQDYPSTSVTFEVKPGKTAKASLKLKPCSKIVFRLKETEEDPYPGKPWLGYKIYKAGVKKPVLIDQQGPYWGDVLWFTEPRPRQASLPIVPGKYTLELVLRLDGSSFNLMSKDNLWSAKLTVNVLPGKHTVIDIPVKSK